MDNADYIDIYCERVTGAFWAEPINAITNLAFLIAAWFAYRFWKAKAAGEKEILALCAILGVIGVGSFLFHTFATHWSMLADVLPIALFIHLAIFSAAYRVFGLGRITSIAVVAAFFAFNFACEKYIPAEWLNRSITYLPAFLALLTMTLLARAKGLQAYRSFFVATILFVASLSLRSIDMAMCETTGGIGTHFMWHVLNGLLLFNIVKGLLLGDLRK